MLHLSILILHFLPISGIIRYNAVSVVLIFGSIDSMNLTLCQTAELFCYQSLYPTTFEEYYHG